jgi:hypothetical protein
LLEIQPTVILLPWRSLIWAHSDKSSVSSIKRDVKKKLRPSPESRFLLEIQPTVILLPYEPTHGRGDGENFNFGLVDINDEPYELLTRAMSAINLIAVKDHASPTRPDASQGVPRAPHDPLSQFKPTLALRDWDRNRGFVRPTSESPMADLYLSWSEKAIYVGLYAQDVVEDEYYRANVVPTEERAHWTVTITDMGKTIRARVGYGLEPSIDEPAARIVNISGLMWNVRNIAAMELPAKLFGKEQFRAGDKIELSSTFLAHGRGYRNDWQGSFTLAE